MKKKNFYQYIFWAVALYLPFTILFIAWLAIVPYIYNDNSSQYEIFYGANGLIAVAWLVLTLLPALLFLLVKSRGYVFLSRFTGVIGFLFLLSSLIIQMHYLALPGIIFLVLSSLLQKQIKR